MGRVLCPAAFRVGAAAVAALAGGLMLQFTVSGQATVPAGSAPAAQTPPAAGRGASPFVPPEPIEYGNREGWTSLFDGRTLTGWDGNPEVWSVEDGAITANSTRERRLGSTHLIWQGGELADFELKLEMKLGDDIHSGIAYRSYVDLNRGGGAGRRGGQAPTAGPAAGPASAAAPAARRGGPPPLQVPAQPRWTLYGPGLDYDYDLIMVGNVEDRGTPRREVAWRGLIVRAEPGKRPRAIGSLGDADELKARIHQDNWNQIHIIARGNQLTHIINGHVMTILLDEDPEYFRASGLIGLQIEQFGFGRVSVRDIWLKR